MVGNKIARALLRAPQQLSYRFEEAGFPDEKYRIDSVILPPREMLVSDLEPSRLLHQPTVREEHDAQQLAVLLGAL